MFETEQLLLTFRLMRLPHAPGETLAVERLADHRSLYLDYEGEIAGGRGSVVRLASGRFRAAATSGPSIRLALAAPQLQAEIEFLACAIGEWTQLRILSWRT